MFNASSLRASLTGAWRDLAGPAPVQPPAAGEFLCGINLGGGPLKVFGDPWQGHDDAVRSGLLDAAGAQVIHMPCAPWPHVQRGARQMLACGVFSPTPLTFTLRLDDVPCALALWILENHQSHWRRQTLRIDGVVRDQGVGDLLRRGWARYGPYPLEVSARRVTVGLDTGPAGVHAHLMGLSLHRVAATG